MANDDKIRLTPRRRVWRLKFSLASFLATIAIVALFLGLFVQRVHRHKEAVAAVRQWESTSIMFDHQLDWSKRSVNMGAAPPTNTWIARLFGADAVITPEQISVNDPEITDHDLKHLRVFRRLRVLGLNCPKITDDGMKHIRQCRALERLTIGNNANITDEGLKQLATLKRLPDLRLQWVSGVTDVGRQELQKALPDCTIRYSLVGEAASSRVVPKP